MADIGKVEGRLVLKDEFSRVLKGASTRLDKFGLDVAKLSRGIAIANTVTAASFTALAFSAVKTSAKYEQLRIQLRTVLGDQERANLVFENLNKFAAATPFRLEKITQAYVQFRAVGLNPTMRDLKAAGDLAAAFSKDITQTVTAITRAAFGEAEPLKQFGILARVEADKIRITFNGVSKDINRNATDIAQHLLELSRTKFGEAMVRQAKSLTGMMTTLTDNWNIFLDLFGQEGLRIVKPFVEGLTKLLQKLASEFGFLQLAAAGAIEKISVGYSILLRKTALLVKAVQLLAKGSRAIATGGIGGRGPIDLGLEKLLEEIRLTDIAVRELFEDIGGDLAKRGVENIKKMGKALKDIGESDEERLKRLKTESLERGRLAALAKLHAEDMGRLLDIYTSTEISLLSVRDATSAVGDVTRVWVKDLDGSLRIISSYLGKLEKVDDVLDSTVKQSFRTIGTLSDDTKDSIAKWADAAFNTADAFGGIETAIGRMITGLGVALDMFLQMQAAGRSIAESAGAAALAFGLQSGVIDQNSTAGGAASGALAGFNVGGGIGAIFGAFIGAGLSMVMDDGIKSGIAWLQNNMGRLTRGGSVGERDAVTGASKIADAIANMFNALLDSIGGKLESALDGVSIGVDGDIVTVMVNGFEEVFNNTQDAINFAVKQLLLTSGISGISANVQKVLKDFVGDSLQNIVAALDLAITADRFNLDPFMRTLQDAFKPLERLRLEFERLGFSLDGVNNEIALTAEGFRNNILGITKDAFEAMVIQAEIFNQEMRRLGLEHLVITPEDLEAARRRQNRGRRSGRRQAREAFEGTLEDIIASRLPEIEGVIRSFNEQIKDLQETAKETGANVDLLNAAIAALQDELKDVLRAIGKDLIASLSPTIAALSSFQDQLDTIVLLRGKFEQLGLTIKEVEDAIDDFVRDTTLGFRTFLAEILNDQELLRRLEILRNRLQLEQMRIQLAMMLSLGLITASEFLEFMRDIDRAIIALDRFGNAMRELVRDLDGAAGGGDLPPGPPPPPGPPTGPTGVELIQDILDELNALRDTGDQTPTERLAEINRQFAEFHQRLIALRGPLELLNEVFEEVVAAFERSLFDPLRALRDELLGNVPGSVAQFSTLQSRFNAVDIAARGGNLDAIGELPSVIRALRDAAIERFGANSAQVEFLTARFQASITRVLASGIVIDPFTHGNIGSASFKPVSGLEFVSHSERQFEVLSRIEDGIILLSGNGNGFRA